MQIVLILHSLVKWAVLIFGLSTLMNALGGVFKKQAVIWVAHRSSTLRLCQTIYELDAGRLLRVEKVES